MGAGWRRFTEKVNSVELCAADSLPVRAWMSSAPCWSCPGFATSNVSGLSLFQARQKWHITADKGFASSSNARNELMLRDAGEFAGHIKRCEKDIRILKNATEGTQLHRHS